MYCDPTLWHALLGRLADDRRAVPAGAGRGRRVGGAAVRLVGRRAVARGLPRSSSRRTRPPCSPRSPTSASRGSTSASAPASCSARWARPAPTSSASTGGCRWTRPSAGSARHGGAGQPRPDRCCSRRPRSSHARAAEIIAAGQAARGHVFNLGHGVLPETDPDVLTRLVDSSTLSRAVSARLHARRGRRRRDRRAGRGVRARPGGRRRASCSRGRTASAASCSTASSADSRSTSAPRRCWPGGPRRVDLVAELGLGDAVVAPGHHRRRRSGRAAPCDRCRRR